MRLLDREVNQGLHGLYNKKFSKFPNHLPDAKEMPRGQRHNDQITDLPPGH